MVRIFTKQTKVDTLPEVIKNWTLVQVFNIYRLCLSLILLGIYFFYFSSTSKVTIVYPITLGIYAALSIIAIILSKKRQFDFENQTIAQVFIDIFVLFLLMEAHPSMIYFYGILINAAIAAGSIIVVGRISLLFAAMASITVLLHHTFFEPSGIAATVSYTRIGVLGGTFFVTAILAYVLSQRVRASEALARQRGVDLAKMSQLNEAIIQRMNSGVIVVDENDQVHFMNRLAENLLDIKEKATKVKIKNLSKPLGDLLLHWRYGNDNLQGTLNINNNTVIVRFVPLGDPNESKFAALIFIEDSSSLTQQAQQIKLASLGRLTASIAHEIRNPLGAISHAGQLLHESKTLSTQEIRLTDIICQQSLRMNHVIENILQLSRRKQLCPSVLLLKEWLTTFILQYQSQQQIAANINLSVNPNNLSVFIDETQLRQVLMNLFDNGLFYSEKHTGKASLNVNAYKNKQTAEVTIEVADQGKGIDKTIAEQMFEPFFTTKEGGTGLGLYIAKEICEANQVSLQYEAHMPEGSCFKMVFKREGYQSP